jgi:hypothetical protein
LADAPQDPFDFGLTACGDRSAARNVLHATELHLGVAEQLSLDLGLSLHSLTDRKLPVGGQLRHLPLDEGPQPHDDLG